MSNRDNQDRIPSPEEGSPSSEEMGDPLSFISPTKVVQLPSQGRFYPEESVLNGTKEIEIESMTAEEEEILNNRDYIKNGTAINKVLDNLIVPDSVDNGELLIGDKNMLLKEIRVDSYGSRYDAKITCGVCAETEEVEYDIEESSEVDEGGVESLSDDVRERFEVGMEDDTHFTMKLPETGVVAVFRLLQSKDQQEIAAKKRNLEKQGIKKDVSQNIEQMKRFVTKLNGDSDPGTIDKFCRKMPAKDSRALRKIYREVAPSLNMKTYFSCGNCDFSEEREVPIRGTFFWPDLQ